MCHAQNQALYVHINSMSSIKQHCEVGTVIITILQIGKKKKKMNQEVKEFAQDYIATK